MATLDFQGPRVLCFRKLSSSNWYSTYQEALRSPLMQPLIEVALGYGDIATIANFITPEHFEIIFTVDSQDLQDLTHKSQLLNDLLKEPNIYLAKDLAANIPLSSVNPRTDLDLLRPAYGIRIFFLGLVGKKKGRLLSLASKTSWRPGPMQAHCRWGSTPPHSAEKCGFFAYSYFQSTKKYRKFGTHFFPDSLHEIGKLPILAITKHWGKIKDHQDGLRSSQAEIIALVIERKDLQRYGDAIYQAAAHYQVPLISKEFAPKIFQRLQYQPAKAQQELLDQHISPTKPNLLSWLIEKFRFPRRVFLDSLPHVGMLNIFGMYALMMTFGANLNRFVLSGIFAYMAITILALMMALSAKM